MLDIHYSIVPEYIKAMEEIKPEKGLKNIEAFKEKIFWALIHMRTDSGLYGEFGNKKIPKTIYIQSFGSWTNCPMRINGECELCEVCYDKYKEVMFRKVLRRRMENENYFKMNSATMIGLEIVGNIIRDGKCIDIEALRINEVGDVRTQYDFHKIIKISNIIYKHLGINTYLYTHNKNLDFFSMDRPHLIVNGSGFMVDNEFRSVEDISEYEYEIKNCDNVYKCIQDCEYCKLCREKNNNIIIEEIF